MKAGHHEPTAAGAIVPHARIRAEEFLPRLPSNALHKRSPDVGANDPGSSRTARFRDAPKPYARSRIRAEHPAAGSGLHVLDAISTPSKFWVVT